MSVTAQAPAAEPTHEEHLSLQRVWFPMLLLGVVSVIAGLFAISFTFAATMASILLLGILLLVAGVTEVLNGVLVRTGKSFALHLLAAALYLIVGVFVLEDPVQAAAVLTLLLAAAFFVGGLLRIVFAIVERFPAWPWIVLHGVVDLLLGVIIVTGWPGSSLRIIGLLLGIDLLFHGWSWVILALTVRTYAAALPDSPRL